MGVSSGHLNPSHIRISSISIRCHVFQHRHDTYWGEMGPSGSGTQTEESDKIPKIVRDQFNNVHRNFDFRMPASFMLKYPEFVDSGSIRYSTTGDE